MLCVLLCSICRTRETSKINAFLVGFSAFMILCMTISISDISTLHFKNLNLLCRPDFQKSQFQNFKCPISQIALNHNFCFRADLCRNNDSKSKMRTQHMDGSLWINFHPLGVKYHMMECTHALVLVATKIHLHVEFSFCFYYCCFYKGQL